MRAPSPPPIPAVPKSAGHCTWEGAKVRFSPGPGHAGSVNQCLESYICGVWELAPGVSWSPGTALCQTCGLISPKPRPQMTSGSEYLARILSIVNIGCWKLQTRAVSCRHWDILVWLNSSLPNIFHRIVSKGVLELIQKKNEIQRKYIFFWIGFDCTSYEDGCWHGCQSYLCLHPENILVISDDWKLISVIYLQSVTRIWVSWQLSTLSSGAILTLSLCLYQVSIHVTQVHCKMKKFVFGLIRIRNQEQGYSSC